MTNQADRLRDLENEVKHILEWMRGQMSREGERAKSESDNRTYYSRLVIGGTVVFFLNSILNGFLALVAVGIALLFNAEKVTAMLNQLSFLLHR